MVASNDFRNLSNADLQKVTQLCEQLHHAEAEDSFVHHCHTTLNQAFCNAHCSAEIYQLNPFELREQELHTVDEHWIPLFKEHVLEHPFARRMPTLTAPEIGMTQMEPTLRKFHRSPLYNEFYEQVGAQNQLWVGIPDGNQLLNCIYSQGSQYTENEMTMLHMIQPHLQAAWKNWRQTRLLKHELNLLKGSIFQSEEEEAMAARIRKTIDALTERQRDMVELVAAGRDNQQMADEFKISVLTVKKHLQMVFKSLEVQHRTELAAQWRKAHYVKLY
jgi:DNA-binding CsgD family transcriptional regulator